MNLTENLHEICIPVPIVCINSKSDKETLLLSIFFKLLIHKNDIIYLKIKIKSNNNIRDSIKILGIFKYTFSYYVIFSKRD